MSGCHLSVNEGAERCHTHRRRLHQPRITVNACPFIEPTFLQCGVGPHTDQVVASVVHIFGHVVILGGVAAGLRAEIEPVEPNPGVAENAVEPQGDMLAQVLSGNADGFPVPPHAGRGIFVAYGLIAMRVACLAGIRQRGHPVVGQAHLLPRRVVELLRIGSLVVYRVGLRQIIEIFGAAAEVLHRVGGMTKGKGPALIEQDVFTRTGLRLHTPCVQQQGGETDQFCLHGHIIAKSAGRPPHRGLPR